MNRQEIESRLRKYLERDRSGIRKELLRILLEGGKYTTDEIFERLSTRAINQRGVSAMVGLMCARLGIIKTELGEKNRYYIKPEYADLVREILREYEGK
ncbi:DUF2551 domain-containing protein [Archaeoglobus veneficus]|uniref:DUF2551 domain-containing protein n=1 Tax=Archaeoglobus veneficus (strain DSM 11195 / SNP6) TaxID=693661 RepID=F2KN66_ARCVS|nr:DUF2551 domain-containing protein [Archaeoglobus veneficus]AEA46167.1 hypothetical protein Arcve_0126 [Archaeoglobus veneficus SNP6]